MSRVVKEGPEGNHSENLKKIFLLFFGFKKVTFLTVFCKTK